MSTAEVQIEVQIDLQDSNAALVKGWLATKKKRPSLGTVTREQDGNLRRHPKLALERSRQEKQWLIAVLSAPCTLGASLYCFSQNKRKSRLAMTADTMVLARSKLSKKDLEIATAPDAVAAVPEALRPAAEILGWQEAAPRFVGALLDALPVDGKAPGTIGAVASAFLTIG